MPPTLTLPPRTGLALGAALFCSDVVPLLCSETLPCADGTGGLTPLLPGALTFGTTVGGALTLAARSGGALTLSSRSGGSLTLTPIP